MAELPARRRAGPGRRRVGARYTGQVVTRAGRGALIAFVAALHGCGRNPPPAPEPRSEGAPAAGLTAQAGEGLVVETIGPRPGVPLEYEAELVGSDRCVTCHPAQGDDAGAHPMARTGRAVTAATRDAWFSAEHLKKPVLWPRDRGAEPPAYRVEPDAVFLEGIGEDGTRASARVAAVFGSGRHGVTPIAAESGRSIRELRLSYFPEESAWRMTPGSADDPDVIGSPSSAERSRWCLGCHSTRLSWRGGALDAEASLLGVHCERCHGPGSRHVSADLASGADLSIFNPGRLPPAEQVAFCGQCHRRPCDLDPGLVLKADPSVARHAGAGLLLSACFRRSPPASTLTCVECHDPHRSSHASGEATSRVCLRCHPRPEEKHRPAATRITAQTDCVPCHLPIERRGKNGLAFVDHWIRVPGAPPPLESPAKAEYLSVLEAAYRAAIERPDRGPEGQAAYWTRLGDLLCSQGRFGEGAAAFQAAIAQDPPYRDHVLLAEKLRRAGRPREGEAVLRAAIRREPSFNRAYYALVQHYLQLGDPVGAEEALLLWKQALPADPVRAEAAADIERVRRSSILKARAPLDRR